MCWQEEDPWLIELFDVGMTYEHAWRMLYICIFWQAVDSTHHWEIYFRKKMSTAAVLANVPISIDDNTIDSNTK